MQHYKNFWHVGVVSLKWNDIRHHHDTKGGRKASVFLSLLPRVRKAKWWMYIVTSCWEMDGSHSTLTDTNTHPVDWIFSSYPPTNFLPVWPGCVRPLRSRCDVMRCDPLISNQRGHYANKFPTHTHSHKSVGEAITSKFPELINIRFVPWLEHGGVWERGESENRAGCHQQIA